MKDLKVGPLEILQLLLYVPLDDVNCRMNIGQYESVYVMQLWTIGHVVPVSLERQERQ